MNKGEIKFQILPQFVDFQEQVNLSSLMDLVITTSGIDADRNGVGIPDLLKFNGTWVLSRFALEIDYLPKAYETIHIETWVHEVHASNTIRNFYIKDKKGEIFGKATSVWAIIDINLRRLIPMSELNEPEKQIINESVEIQKPLKIKEVINEPIYKGKVKYSDIDINQHVNTRNYIRWMMDTFSLEELKQKQISRIDLNFLSEMVFNNEYYVHKNEFEENNYRFDIKTNNRTACRGQLKFKQIIKNQ